MVRNLKSERHMTYEEFDEHELAEKQWIESHSAVLAASPVVVRIERW